MGGSVFFVLVPYVANLFIASRIKNIIRNNAAAKAWFQSNTPVFTVLVVLSGGCHAALSLVSSRISGLTILTCGLTQYELKQLGKLKVIGTVLIENIPQLICQALSSISLGGKLTSAVQLAFIASALSVVASTLSYLIEKDTSDTKVVQYYLSTQCSLRGKSFPDTNRDGDDIETGTDKVLKTMTSKGELIDTQSPRAEDNDSDPMTPITPSSSNVMTFDERRNLVHNRGRTQALGESIAEVFGIPTRNIEVGHSMITKYGISTHIVHYVYDIDLETMEEELLNENMSNNQIGVTPKYFVSQLFTSLEPDITRVFRKHFELNKDFQVTFQRRLGIRKRTLTEQKNDDIDGRRSKILKRVITQIGSNNIFDPDQDIKYEVMNGLRELFQREGTGNYEEKLNLCSELIQTIDSTDDDDHNDDFILLNDDSIQKSPSSNMDHLEIEMVSHINQRNSTRL